MNQDFLGYLNTSKLLKTLDVSSNFNMSNFINANLNWLDKKFYFKASSTNLTLPSNTTSFFSNSVNWFSYNNDRVSSFTKLDTAPVLRGREELSPGYIFNSY